MNYYAYNNFGSDCPLLLVVYDQDTRTFKSGVFRYGSTMEENLNAYLFSNVRHTVICAFFLEDEHIIPIVLSHVRARLSDAGFIARFKASLNAQPPVPQLSAVGSQFLPAPRSSFKYIRCMSPYSQFQYLDFIMLKFGAGGLLPVQVYVTDYDDVVAVVGKLHYISAVNALFYGGSTHQPAQSTAPYPPVQPFHSVPAASGGFQNPYSLTSPLGYPGLEPGSVVYPTERSVYSMYQPNEFL